MSLVQHRGNTLQPRMTGLRREITSTNENNVEFGTELFRMRQALEPLHRTPFFKFQFKL